MCRPKETATEVLIRAMEKIQDAPDVRVVILLDSFGEDENMIALDSNSDIVSILGMLNYAVELETDIIRRASREQS